MRTPDRARLAVGTAVLVRPELPLILAQGGRRGHHPDRRAVARTRRVIQILGARYVVQAVAGSAVRRPWVPTADATVDLVHAVSMAVLARQSKSHRRLAIASAATAVLFAAADIGTHPRLGRARTRSYRPDVVTG